MKHFNRGDIVKFKQDYTFGGKKFKKGDVVRIEEFNLTSCQPHPYKWSYSLHKIGAWFRHDLFELVEYHVCNCSLCPTDAVKWKKLYDEPLLRGGGVIGHIEG
jgi:hypothetical protein